MGNHPRENFPQENFNGKDTLHSNRWRSESSMALKEEEDEEILFRYQMFVFKKSFSWFNTNNILGFLALEFHIHKYRKLDKCKL